MSYFAGRKEKRARARRIYHSKCCKEGCLTLLGKTDALLLVESCLDEVEGMHHRNELHKYLFQKLLHATKGISSTGKTIETL